MLQEFYKSTLISKYIKYLLSRTPLPLLKLIYDNETMYEGSLYIYKDKVLRCTKTGRFVGVNGSLGLTNFLYAQEPLRVSDTTTMKVHTVEKSGSQSIHTTTEYPLSVTDDYVSVDMHSPAQWKVVRRYEIGTHVPGVTYRYNSKSSYYDAATHCALGDYIRYIENVYDMNLMPLYNCFTDKWVYSFSLSVDTPSGIATVTSNKTKVTLVPIKFDKKYTIVFDCDQPILAMPVLYNGDLMYTASKQDYLHTSLSNFSSSSESTKMPIKINGVNFNKPFVFSIEESSPFMIEHERYLYLAIQVPYEFEGSFTVVESDITITNSSNSVSDISGLHNRTPREIARTLTSKLSLMSNNDGVPHPFSDRLVEYLLRNTIDNREYIDENVTTIQKCVDFDKTPYGEWTLELQYSLFNEYFKILNRSDLNRYDILGYVDKDIEEAVRKGYIKT